MPEISTDDLRQQQLRNLIAPLNNPWKVKDASDGNPWDRPSRCGGQSDGGVKAVKAEDNPWAIANQAAHNSQCSMLWNSMTSELDLAWERSREAWSACKQYKFGPEWNACAERMIQPAQAAVKQMIDQRSASMNECRGWIAANKYNEIADRVDSVKGLYDKAVATPAIVAKIQDSARSMIRDQHTAVLGQVGEVACGMDEISGNPWR